MTGIDPTQRTFQVDSAGHTLRGDAAASYLRAIADGLPTGGVDVFQRTWEEQQAVYDAYLHHGGRVCAERGARLADQGRGRLEQADVGRKAACTPLRVPSVRSVRALALRVHPRTG